MNWSVENTEQLRKLYAAGMSASQIANEMKLGLSRNAIIGKVHRLGLEPRGRTFKRENKPAPRQPAKRRTSLLATRWGAYDFVPKAPEPIAFVDVVLDPLNITFAEIGDGLCKSITNDDMKAPLYCGHFVEQGSHYCRPHRRLFYNAGKRHGVREASLVSA